MCVCVCVCYTFPRYFIKHVARRQWKDIKFYRLQWNIKYVNCKRLPVIFIPCSFTQFSFNTFTRKNSTQIHKHVWQNTTHSARLSLSTLLFLILSFSLVSFWVYDCGIEFDKWSTFKRENLFTLTHSEWFVFKRFTGI